MNDREAIDRERADLSALESALTALGATIKGKDCTCPYHEDKNPSASILETPSGAWKVYCHRCKQGWDVFDLRAKASGRDTSELLKAARTNQQQVIQSNTPTATQRQPEPPPLAYATLEAVEKSLGQSLEATYAYRHPETGHLDMVVFRLRKEGGKKTFLQGHETERGIVLKAPPKPWPLYRRDLLATSERVAVVEGEKCADALNAIGIPATTSPGGAGKASITDWTPLAGKRVDLWPDNDPPDEKTGRRTGIDHMRDVARILATIRPNVAAHWLEPEGLGLPEKGDAADLLEKLDGQDTNTCLTTVKGILDDSVSMGASAGVKALIEDTITGKRIAAPFPWSPLTMLTKALLPGTVTLLGGAGGSTKSFLMMQCLSFWHAQKIPAEIYMLEDDRTYHLYRALAQRSNNANVFDDDWIRANPDEIRTIWTEHQVYLDALGPSIHDNPGDKQISLADLAEWVRERAKAGTRIIAIDPITAAQSEDKAWAEDLAFIMSVKAAVREYGTSLVLITHPKKGVGSNRGKPSMDDLAGGAAYQRFSHTILMLDAQDSKETLIQTMEDGEAVVRSLPVNRLMRVHKARNGRGTGMQLGMFFNGGTLKFRSQGIIQGKGCVGEMVDTKASENDAADPPAHSSGRTRHDRINNQGAQDELPF